MSDNSSEPRVCKRGHVIAGENAARNGKSVTCRTCKNDLNRAKYWADPEKARKANRERMRAWLGPMKGNAQARKTHCPLGHPYDEENTYVMPNGGRQCKICRKVRVKESYDRHREKRNAEHREWREANLDRVKENLRRWNQENRERANLLSRLKKQRRRHAGTLTADEWELVLDTYGRACLACGATEDITIDHVVPTSKGGLNTIDNVQPLCGTCNSSKYTKTIDYRPFPISVLADAA